MPDALDGSAPTHGVDTGRLYGSWYYDTYTVPYHDTEHWRTFFGKVADGIVREFNPKTVLDAGCASGYLVAALRERGVDAWGFDLSEYAIESAEAETRDYLRVGSLLDPIDQRYDLVTCIEVIEHLDPTEGPTAVANLCGASDVVLFSSAPEDFAEATHTNLLPAEQWSRLFAQLGFFRSLDREPRYLSPWAATYERQHVTLVDLATDYDRALSRLQREVVEQREALLRAEATLERLDREAREHQGDSAEIARLREDVLRLKDLLVGHEAETAAANGKVAELSAWVRRYDDLVEFHEAVLTSRSWRTSQALLAPLRWVRSKRQA